MEKQIIVSYAPSFNQTIKLYVDYKDSRGNPRDAVKEVVFGYLNDFHYKVSRNPEMFSSPGELFGYGLNHVKHALYENSTHSYKVRIVFAIHKNLKSDTIHVKVYAFLDQSQSIQKQLNDFCIYEL